MDTRAERRGGRLVNAFDAAQATREVWDRIWEVASTERVVVVNSPPGAGKSTLTREMARRAMLKYNQVPIVVQTNEQADDMVVGFLWELDRGIGSGLRIGRLHGGQYRPPLQLTGDPRVVISGDIRSLAACDIIVAPAAKWAFVRERRWPFAIVDEAYQMRSDALLPVGAMMARLLVVGDPGQLAPFTIADARHLRGLQLSPLQTAAATILTTHPHAPQVSLPVSWRLQANAVDVLAPAFYEHPFVSGVADGTRQLEMPIAAVNTLAQAAIRSAANTGWAFCELPDLMMPNVDPAAVTLLAEIISELLRSNIIVHDERGHGPLRTNVIAVGVTHRDQRDHVRVAVDNACQEIGLPPSAVVVDTANRLQGREFDVVIAWHPLSGRRDATEFHLDAGRLCVLLSRHRHACIVVSRGGLRERLLDHPATDPVWLGEQIPVVDGWQAHLSVLEHLEQYALSA
jgi:hypothetical protein